ncbi:MAG: hypothetical protein CVT96_08315 [Bacteroidetes bacterium HGW-Bacteroidetes-13]|nr:MAG: hypothetical protein CVT96_08315 [Bacteroidetes bacterium HGW-Bacteroidetes-13]
MKTQFLFPHRFKIFGWMLFVPTFLIGTYLYVTDFEFDEHLKLPVFSIYNDDWIFSKGIFKFIENGVVDELLTVLIVIGALLIGFSKTRKEDEYISKIRYESLVWATYFNFAVILFSTLFFYGFAYFHVMVGNIFTILIFFIVRFHYKLYKANISTDEE